MQAKYLLKVHPLIFSEDLPRLPKELQSDFEKLFKPILQLSPNDGGIFISLLTENANPFA
jgi:hypothetical protein